MRGGGVAATVGYEHAITKLDIAIHQCFGVLIHCNLLYLQQLIRHNGRRDPIDGADGFLIRQSRNHRRWTQ